MALSEEQETCVLYIVWNEVSFQTQFVKLEEYLERSNSDHVNAKARSNTLSALYKEYLKYSDELAMLDSTHAQLDVFLEVESRYFDVVSTMM